MQKTVGLSRVGSGRSGRNNFGFHTSGVNYDGKIAGLYDLEETLGRGHFAVVKLARHVFTGEKVAVKVIDKTKLDEVSRSHLFQEVRCMKLVQHPNVVRLYEVIDTQTKLYLILELGDGGDLYDYIMRHENGLDQESARHYFRQVVHAISYCHQLHVVHRDLKPENVVFFEKLGMVKLTDFGFSNKYNPGQKLETSCGSLAYSAPEILLGDSYDAPAVDIWSLGVILYMLVCGHPPFQEANDSETLTMIMDCKYTVPPHVSDGCRRLIARMLQRDPSQRANLEEIANDPWLLEGTTRALQLAAYLPLVSREHLTEEDHALILQKMVNGSIATKEEIIDALDKDEYNNITATYFLLAERKLRAQRQEQALMLSRGHPPPPPLPHPEQQLADLKEGLPEESKAPTKVALPVPGRGTVMESLQGSSSGRTRKYSAVEEEDESCVGPGSGSESSRRSQRSSSNSLASQRTSNTSLASQRASNNSLAGSLRARGLLNNIPTTGAGATSTSTTPTANRSTELRLELIAENVLSTSPELSERPAAAAHSLEPQRSFDQPLEVPAPFPTTSNIGLGLRSPRASPITSPVTGHRISAPIVPGSGRTTPASSVSPTSPTTPLSPATSPTVIVGGNGRTTLPSSNRVLHSVRSSPQLMLNEIFEEAESDSEMGGSLASKSPGLKHRAQVINNMCSRQRPGSGRASSAGPSCSSAPTSNSTALVQRRYEQRRQLVKSRTASCSSSDASDNDDNEGRKKRADKLHSKAGRVQPNSRRDSHDDSSDPGGEGGYRRRDGDGNGLCEDGGSIDSDSGQPGGSTSQNSGGANSRDNAGGSESSGRNQFLFPDENGSVQKLLAEQHRSRYRQHGHHLPSHHKGRRYTNACSFSLLSPGLGSDTLLRASQSLSCLTEVCEAGLESPRILTDSLCVPDQFRQPPARSCSNLEKVDEPSAALAESREILLLRPASSNGRCEGRNQSEPPEIVIGVQDVVMRDALTDSPDHHAGRSCSSPPTGAGGSKKQKRLKQLFSRREGSNSSFKKGDKRWASKKNRGRNGGGHASKDEMTNENKGAENVAKNPVDSTEEASVSGDASGRTMSFLRSRLYKAKSLGSLVKERILVEASHCQYELWRRLGRSPTKTGDVNMNGAALPAPALLKTSQPAKPTGSQPDQQCCSITASMLDSSTC